MRHSTSAGAVAALLVALCGARAYASGSCYDGERNGPESDVDCGGDCPLCDVGKMCRIARDCRSGMCNEGICEEHPWKPGDRIPNGYRTELSTYDRAASARIGGGWFVGIGYGAAYASALTFPNQISAMYIPVVGPWIALGHAAAGAPKTLVISDGVVQDVGAVLLIGGILGAGQQLVRERKALARFDVVPIVGRRECALDVVGLF